MKIAILISGWGSNMAALLTAAADPGFPVDVGLVVSNRPGAPGLEKAAGHGVPTLVIDHKQYDSREAFEAALTDALTEAGAELVCLAGFMRLLTDGFVEQWRDRLINIHPSLLPAFRGLHTHDQALAAGVRLHGCTVHFTRPAMDEGPIIAQAAVSVLPEDDSDSLAARVLQAEHHIYPLAVRLIAEGRVRIEAERVVVDGHAAPETPLINPAG